MRQFHNQKRCTGNACLTLQLDVEVAPPADVPWPAPLEEGVAEEIHKGFIASPVPTPDKEVT